MHDTFCIVMIKSYRKMCFFRKNMVISPTFTPKHSEYAHLNNNSRTQLVDKMDHSYWLQNCYFNIKR